MERAPGRAGRQSAPARPAAASGPGAGGTFWRTDLSLFTPSETATLHVSLGFLPGGRDNRDVAEATVTWTALMTPKRTVVC